MSLTIRRIAAALALLTATGWCLWAAQPASSQTRRSDAAAASRPHGDRPEARAPVSPPALPALTPGREAAALTFARLHHPELADLLERLKNVNPPEYRRAVRELFQDSERLARMAERSPERYEPALELWKVDSRIRLLAARMTMSEDPALEAELKAALHERLEIRLQQLQFERERLAARMVKIDETVSEIELDREGRVLRELQRIRRGLRAAPAARPAATPETTSP